MNDSILQIKIRWPTRAMHKTNVKCIKKVYKISVFTMQIKWLKCKIKIVDQYKKKFTQWEKIAGA